MVSTGEVLVIDGDAAIRRLLEVVVGTISLKAVLVSDARRALELIQSRAFDALIVELPPVGGDGTCVLDEVGRARPEMLGQTIVLTTAPERSWKQHPHTAAVAAVLRKPFAVTDLQNALRKCCRVDGNGGKSLHSA